MRPDLELVRAEYAERQAALVRAVVTGCGAPPGFDPEQVEAVADVLLRQRPRAVARARPALAHALGPEFEAAFAEYASASPVPHEPDAIADGLAFACTLEFRRLDDAAQRENVLARARWAIRSGRARPRLLPFIGIVGST